MFPQGLRCATRGALHSATVLRRLAVTSITLRTTPVRFSSSSATGGKDSDHDGDGGTEMKSTFKRGSARAGASFAGDSSISGTSTGYVGAGIRSTVYAHSKLTENMKAPAGVASSAVPSASPVSRRTQPAFLRSNAASSPQSHHGSATTGAASHSEKELQETSDEPNAIKTAARPEHGPMVPDYGPMRQTGLWSVEEVLDDTKKTVNFRRIDDVESEIIEEMKDTDEALVPYEEEDQWKHKLMFACKFKKTPKHLTWKELGEEIECMDCSIDLDEHRPEEMFTINFYFTDKKTGTRDIVWSARNDVSYSEGFTDLLAAVGACLGRSDVHRTIRFDDGQGTCRELTLRKRSRYTSDIQIAFRPPTKYNLFQRKEERDEYEEAMEAQGMSTWGYHPSLMDPEYNELDFEDPEGTYEVAMSAHGLSFVFLRAIRRLLGRPMKDFYRPSQLMRTAKVRSEDDIGFSHAMAGWMGIEEQIYAHYTPIEALQDHWLGKDAPFSLCAIINKLREMTYLKKENPELQSWLSVRHHDTHVAIRNMGVKLLGVGASTLFVPASHNATVNRLLPKQQQRRLESKFSINAVLGLPDETRRIEEFKQITGHARLTEPDGNSKTTTTGNAEAQEGGK